MILVPKLSQSMHFILGSHFVFLTEKKLEGKSGSPTFLTTGYPKTI